MALALAFRPLAPPARRRVDTHRRRRHPADARRDIGERPVEMRAFVVAAFVPGSVEARRHPPVEPVPPLDADPEVAKLRLVREPMLARARQQARLAGAADQPARAHMARNGHLVELVRAVLAARDVGARAQPPAVLQRVLVFPAGPDRDADTGLGLVVAAPER